MENKNRKNTKNKIKKEITLEELGIVKPEPKIDFTDLIKTISDIKDKITFDIKVRVNDRFLKINITNTKE